MNFSESSGFSYVTSEGVVCLLNWIMSYWAHFQEQNMTILFKHF